MTTAQVLVEVTRGPLVENRHRGHVAVVDWQGKLLYSAGDPYHTTFWRSAAKPIQALPVVETGAADRFGITPKELALFCASHSGEAMHTDTVLAILDKIGLAADHLSCGQHMPYHPDTQKAMLSAGQQPSALHCNCSGKHAGMLTLVAHQNWSAANYIDLGHPLQQQILDYIALLCDFPRHKISIGIDGCGVPVHGLPIYNMSLAYARLARPQQLPPDRAEGCRRVTQAMLTHPEMVGGTDRFCTELMRHTHGKLVGKAGAAGVYCVGLIDQGIGITVKCEDGSGRARDPVVVEILHQLGFITDQEAMALEKFHRPKNLTHRQEQCGEVVPVVKLKKEG